MSERSGAGLPVPDPAAAEHSQAVAAALARHVDARGGAVSFADFQQFVLYAPGLGYYSAGATKFGAGGDFITAPEVSPLFATILARQWPTVHARLGGGSVVEFGAGTGALAHDFLAALADNDALPARYLIVEVSAELRQRQQERLAQLPAACADRVQWVDSPNGLEIDGLVLANEVLDAVPVERFRIGTEGAIEQLVVTMPAGTIVPQWRAAPDPLADAVSALQDALGRALPPGYVSEVAPMADGVVEAMAGALRAGVVLLCDYGYDRQTYYAPERTDGTLTCHFRHHVHADPFVLPGIQDLTAWVDFSRTAERLGELGLGYLGFTPQAEFLLAGGLADAFSGLPGDAQAALSPGIKTLTLPGAMGERFKFLGFHRDCPVALPGFSGRDFGRLL